MRKRRSHEEFVKEFALINPDIEVLEEFINFKTNVKCRCKKCGLIWKPNMSAIFYKHTGCPICNHSNPNRIVAKGINDMWTSSPDIAILLADPEDGYKYTMFSNVKTNWRCPNCGSIIYNKFIPNVVKQGIPCPYCKDGISYPEKFVADVLRQSKITFESQKVFKWSNKKRYDFFISTLNIICEVHGEQHYKTSFKQVSARSLKEEQENDEYKEQLVKQNTNYIYIIIDAKISDMNYIKDSILNSTLKNYIDLSNIDWGNAHKNALKSKVVEVCNLWNEGVRNTLEIANLLGLGRNTIIGYLKQGALINLCDYDSENEIRLGRIKNSGLNQQVKVLCLNTNETFNSVSSAARRYNLKNYSNISLCCKGKRNTAGKDPLTNEGLKWQYVS